ncbi:hypothetical protein BGW38_008662 [Lunasporangiospora selenospora]|uniref:Uncharacterized protein n=1 Tax=Lunasporangiospora selenospora TaxID=979761 RepID=A0A9P6KGH0_9FUNG|nr:hypothetical protein BGW38_008662 [Lunasporangiospora selenospora]
MRSFGPMKRQGIIATAISTLILYTVVASYRHRVASTMGFLQQSRLTVVAESEDFVHLPRQIMTISVQRTARHSTPSGDAFFKEGQQQLQFENRVSSSSWKVDEDLRAEETLEKPRGGNAVAVEAAAAEAPMAQKDKPSLFTKTSDPIDPSTFLDTQERSSLPPNTQRSEPKHKVNAVFVMLLREKDLYGAKEAIRQIEDRFNHRYGYPYVFLNEKPFSEMFKDSLRAISKSEMKFGLIPTEHWSYPSWISKERAAEARKSMKKIIYGWSQSYRHMCRYQSGFFFQHELMLPYDYYWRIEPDVRYSCDIDFDPFLFMHENNKTYAFTVSLKEYPLTIPTLWNTTKEFMEKYPQYIAKNNALGFISNDGGESYNYCHFWSNFEIADARWMRSEAYQKYFEHLDQAGGFFYERWGDAPVHSIAAALLLSRDQIHFFREIGYFHNPFHNCPAEPELQAKCHCDPDLNIM